MKFTGISLSGWQQFDKVELALHPRLTVLTGANGSGKSTLLRFLARHFGWPYNQLSTPRKDPASGVVRFLTALFGLDLSRPSEDQVAVGEVSYSSGRKSPIRIPAQLSQASYQPTIDNPEQVAGLFLPADRPEFVYAPVQQIPPRAKRSMEAFNEVNNMMRDRAMGGSGRAPAFQMKEILVGLALFGSGGDLIERDDEARRLFSEFQDVLKSVLPPELGFTSMTVRANSELVLLTGSGEFMLDAVSGGVGAIISLAWQIFMYSNGQDQEFTVAIDEPETHLHASMQRQLLPSFLKAFPKTQFVVATHSPLVVGSQQDANVYALAFSDSRRVYSRTLDLQDRTGSASEIYRDVLGIDSTLPLWLEERIGEIIQKYSRIDLDKKALDGLRSEMAKIGLDKWVPEAAIRLADERGRKRQ